MITILLLLFSCLFFSCSLNGEIEDALVESLYGNCTELFSSAGKDSTVSVYLHSISKPGSEFDGVDMVVVKMKGSSGLHVKHVDKKGLRSDIYPDFSDSNSAVVVNGGYFGYNHKNEFIPLGLAVEHGAKKSSQKNWSIGGVVFKKDDVVTITEIDSFTIDSSISTALQCKPLLVHNGKNEIFAKNLSYRNRTAVALDEEGNLYIIGVFNMGTGAMTLYDFAKILSYENSKYPKIKNALALDGGSSSYMYIPSLKRGWGVKEDIYIPNVITVNW